MKTTSRSDQGKTPAATPDLPNTGRSDPVIGIIVAVIVAAFFWPIIIGLYVYFTR